MKKLIVTALACFSMVAFAGEEFESNYVQDAIAEYDALIAASKVKGISKTEKKELQAEANAIKTSVVNFGKMFSAIAQSKYRGVYVIPEEFKTRYEDSTNGVVDVYNMTLKIKWPWLNKGIRTYKTSTCKGYLVCGYAEAGDQISDAFLTFKNPNTKSLHTIEFEEADYWLMGKSNKSIARTEPSVYFEGADGESPIPVGNVELHELITKITFAGGGACTVKSVTTYTTGCNACSEPTTKKQTVSCVKMKSMSGFVTGKMECECPEDEAWTHTLLGASCGLYLDAEGNPERSSEAAFAGQFSATYNSTASR